MRRRLLVAAIAVVAASMPPEMLRAKQGAATTGPFYVVAHMANTLAAVDWALEQGANALEMDLHFDSSGMPELFNHGGICDCTCSPWCLVTNNNGDPAASNIEPDICKPLGCKCNASTAAATMFAALAKKPTLALVIIDSKVTGAMSEKLLARSGRAVIAAVNEQLFAQGYAGNVVVSAGKADAFTYLQNAASAAASGQFADRTFVGLDQVGGSTANAVCALNVINRLETKARAFGTGITACLNGSYEAAIATAAANRDKDEPSVGPVYVWTLDRDASLRAYITFGPSGIMTNRPARLLKAALDAGLQIAVPETRLPLATTVDVTGGDAAACGCDCDYHPGGCRISFPAPRGKACKCVYESLLWRCKGAPVNCSDPVSPFCMLPDSSKESCLLGGGDCLGYK